MAAPPKSLAKDLFTDMGRKVAEASEEDLAAGESRLVESIEDTLCMNCYKSVSPRERFYVLNIAAESMI
jgi:zinc finger protein